MEKYVGCWQYERSENLEEFMIATGIGYANREIVKRLTPTVEFKWTEGKRFRVITKVNRFLSRTLEIVLDEEYEEKTPIGDMLKGTWVLHEDGRMIGTFIWVKEIDQTLTITREFNENGKVIKQTSCSHGVTSVRYFRKK